MTENIIKSQSNGWNLFQPGFETKMGLSLMGKAKPSRLGEKLKPSTLANSLFSFGKRATDIRMCSVLLNGLATLSRTILSRKENNLKWLFLL